MLSAHLRQRIGRWIEPHPAPPVPARLYLTAACGLCEQARAVLDPFERRGRLAVEPVDIAVDPELFRRYGLQIPVLELEGGPTLEWPFDAAAVRQALG